MPDFPCPFCGECCIFVNDKTPYSMYAYCDDCGAAGPIKETAEDALAAWQKRIMLEAYTRLQNH